MCNSRGLEYYHISINMQNGLVTAENMRIVFLNINVPVQHMQAIYMYIHVGTESSLVTRHDALLLRQIARDHLQTLSQRCGNTRHDL